MICTNCHFNEGQPICLQKFEISEPIPELRGVFIVIKHHGGGIFNTVLINSTENLLVTFQGNNLAALKPAKDHFILIQQTIWDEDLVYYLGKLSFYFNVDNKPCGRFEDIL